jgi:NADH-quinone oxidoreductase subunit E
MSVRRLADSTVQPATFAFNKAMAAQAKVWIKKFPKGREQSAVIPLLMLAQEQDGWVTRAAIEYVAAMLNMPDIRVLEVATFYTQFQLKPVGGRAHIQVCGTTPCMIMGAGALMDVCRSKIHHDQFTPSADGALSWEEVECLGACVNAPMVMIFKDTYEDLTPERLSEIIDLFEAGKGDTVKPGPQTDRFYSAPASGFTSLTDEKALLVKKGKAAARSETASAAPKLTAEPAMKAKPAKVPANKIAPAGASTTRSAANLTGAAKAASPAAKAEKAWADKPEAEKRATKPSKPAGRTAANDKPSLESAARPKKIERPSVVDDLKLISGVGPKIERTLHELGIFTFAQVAGWKKEQREWVDSYLSFSGRIERDNWVKQAAALAKGGVAEYVRVFGKKPV